MTFLYEQLGDETFQELAQAILTEKFPNAQCLPVSQPDGGRDAFSWRNSKPNKKEAKKDTIIFQVKFARDPKSKDERAAIESLISSEADKVERLKKKGAVEYYLITNVHGTAHLDVGSIDRVNAELTKAFKIPAYCWWREDIDARIHSSSDIKWSFPQIMRGTDVLQLFVDSANGSQDRKLALQAYMADQYGSDSSLKFKQAQLQNRLADLFVDVPIEPLNNDGIEGQRAAHRVGEQFSALQGFEVLGSGHGYTRRRKIVLASELLLRHPLEAGCNRLVMQGAPGQGKSTITQYICQVHRCRFLDYSQDLADLGGDDTGGPLRLPFRIDLRDYATWIEGKNPFSPKEDVVGGRPVGLEGFIAAQVKFGSGGQEFSVADFVATCKTSHVLIALDGFDEVADVEMRNKVVEEVSKAANRIHANARSALLIVTSRPSAFANSPGFPPSDWMHFELKALTPEIVESYATKWMKAKGLSERDKEDFKKLVAVKLSQPHMRDLARNPMQLTILLALVQTQGLSLPDKRTALYDLYMGMFFSREAEKSAVIRERRDLVANIHQYLAWRLQAEAEKGRTRGSITEAALKELLEQHLRAQGHKTDLVDQLFTGVVERVVALVQRMVGLYEFEVQPLREYFAGRYLYNTAPYSPPGNEKKGTKPDRFNAIARNFYWLNVSRFFGGCFSSGELSTLADSLEELATEGDYARIAYPTNLALMLLGDWVFNQQPRVVERVVKNVLRLPQLKIFMSVVTEPSNPTELPQLPTDCGREVLVNGCMEYIQPETPKDFRHQLFAAILRNTSSVERMMLWRKLADRMAAPDLLDAAVNLELLGELETDDLLALRKTLGRGLVHELLNAGFLPVIYSSEFLVSDLMELVTNDLNLYPNFDSVGMSPAHVLTLFTNPEIFQHSFAGPFSFRESFRRLGFRNNFDLKPKVAIEGKFPELKQMRGAADELMKIIRSEVTNWSEDLQPWRELIDVYRKYFGPCRISRLIALLASGSKSTQGRWGDEAWADKGDLAGRLRFARLRSGNSEWWRAQFLSLANADPDDQELCALTFAVWATPKTIADVAKEAAIFIDGLDEVRWAVIASAASQINDLYHTAGIRRRDAKLTIKDSKLSLRLAFLVANRGSEALADKVYAKYFANYRGNDKSILSYTMQVALRRARHDQTKWKEVLGVIKYGYRNGGTTWFPRGTKISQVLARTICDNAGDYPNSLIALAERTLSARVGSMAPKIDDVARKEGWFS